MVEEELAHAQEKVEQEQKELEKKRKWWERRAQQYREESNYEQRLQQVINDINRQRIEPTVEVNEPSIEVNDPSENITVEMDEEDECLELDNSDPIDDIDEYVSK